jgi:ribosomal protein S13
MYREIERLLIDDEDFSVKQTLGHPFRVFKIKGVGSIVEELIAKTATFMPPLKLVYKKVLEEDSKSLKDQGISSEEIYGRIARMWASLIREWHAYYMILEEGYKFGLNSDIIIRNDILDLVKGIDVYILNEKNKDESFKLDILQSTKRAKEFRDYKDTKHYKDYDIKGKRYQILIGYDMPETTKTVNGWYLLKESYAERIIKYYLKTIGMK